jgi:hypothetical protein
MSDQLPPITEAEREWHRKRAYEASLTVENAKAESKEREPTDAERKQYQAYLAAGGPAGEPESLDRAGIGRVEASDAEAQGKAARTKAEKQAEKDEAEAEERERQRQAQAHHRA